MPRDSRRMSNTSKINLNLGCRYLLTTLLASHGTQGFHKAPPLQPVSRHNPHLVWPFPIPVLFFRVLLSVSMLSVVRLFFFSLLVPRSWPHYNRSIDLFWEQRGPSFAIHGISRFFSAPSYLLSLLNSSSVHMAVGSKDPYQALVIENVNHIIMLFIHLPSLKPHTARKVIQEFSTDLTLSSLRCY